MKKILLLILLLMFLGCQFNNIDNCPKPRFANGDFVTSVVGNHTGQIVRVRLCREGYIENYYDVRFNIKSNKTNTNLLNSDDDIETGLSLITWMKWYELRKTDNINNSK